MFIDATYEGDFQRHMQVQNYSYGRNSRRGIGNPWQVNFFSNKQIWLGSNGEGTN